MNWQKFLGIYRYRKLVAVCEERHMTIATAVRIAVDKLITPGKYGR